MKTVGLLITLFCSFAQAAYTVSAIKGKVTYDGLAIKVGHQLTPGKVLIAEGKTSSVALKMQDGSALKLKNGKLKLEALATDSQPSLFALLQGQLFAAFKKRQKGSKTRLRIKTNTAVAGVRGTQFLIHEKMTKTYFCVTEGKIELSRGEQRLDLGAGFDVWAKPEKPDVKLTKATNDMLDMVADETEAMGFSVNRFWSK